MRPSAQPQQHSYQRTSWQPDAPNAPNGPTRPASYHSASGLNANLHPQQQTSQTQAHPAYSPVFPMPDRFVNPFVNPYEHPPSNRASVDYGTHRNVQPLQFGPGDPLFAGARSSAPAPSRPTSLGAPPLVHAPRSNPSVATFPSTPHTGIGQRTVSSPSAQASTPARTGASHRGPRHEFDDCPGCCAEMEDAIKASLHSAKQEDESRHNLREQQELDRIYALTAEEEERRRRLEKEEEELLQKAMEDSRREAELQAQKEARLLEESRQYAIRQREKSAQLELQNLEAAKLASAEQEEQRRKDLNAMQDAEKRALQLSLEEQEEEWARRESAERMLLEFLEQRGARDCPVSQMLAPESGASSATFPSSSNTSPSLRTPSRSSTPGTLEADDLEAEYWRFAGHDEAYRLARQMQQASLNDSTGHRQSQASGSRIARPLPPTPGSAAGSSSSIGQTFATPQKHDPRPLVTQPAPLHAADDAPPAYSEATPDKIGPHQGASTGNSSTLLNNGSRLNESQPGPSNRAHLVESNLSSAQYPPEKVSSPRYDASTLEELSRPVLQQRSSSSSSRHSQMSGSRLNRMSIVSTPGAASIPSSPSPAPSGDGRSPRHSVVEPTTPSIPERGSSHNTPVSKRTSASGSSLIAEQRGQRALTGLDFGYCNTPFAAELDKSRLPYTQTAAATTASTSSVSVSTSAGKLLFPNSIELASISKAHRPAILGASSFFVLRALSWKSLLRALAWYGNSRVEAGPEEVAAAGDRRTAANGSGRCYLHAEVEFVTPTRVDMGMGVGDFARASQSTAGMPRNSAPAHVALCISLVPTTSAGGAGAWLKSEEYQTIKRESRRLDAWYAGRGSARRLIQLARQPPSLPVPLVEVAQLLHASHTFSAACPSSGSTARHSPRDLHHAIERHDEGFVRKQQAMLAASSALASANGIPGSASTTSLALSNPRFSMTGPSRTSISTEQGRFGDDDDDLDDDDDEIDVNDFSLLEHGLAADGSFDAQDKVLMGKRQRLKAKVKRRLAKRSSDGRVVDEDLATWITPFDLSQHG